MQVSASYTFDVPAARVWDTLMDPAIVCVCLPGCRELRPLGGDKYEAGLTVAVSAITGTFKGTIAIENQVPPRSYRLVVEGSGGAGFVRGHSTITLAEDGAKTVVDVAGDVQVGGAVARVGQRLLSGVSKMMMDRFFECLRQQVKASG
ncbi:MAG: CoxG family protein [Vicinamibacterales bacterium]